jgi:hypothetical protein
MPPCGSRRPILDRSPRPAEPEAEDAETVKRRDEKQRQDKIGAHVENLAEIEPGSAAKVEAGPDPLQAGRSIDCD